MIITIHGLPNRQLGNHFRIVWDFRCGTDVWGADVAGAASLYIHIRYIMSVREWV